MEARTVRRGYQRSANHIYSPPPRVQRRSIDSGCELWITMIERGDLPSTKRRVQLEKLKKKA